MEVRRKIAETANVPIADVIRPSAHRGRASGDNALFVYDVLFDFLAPAEDHRNFRTLVTQNADAIFTSCEAFDGHQIQVYFAYVLSALLGVLPLPFLRYNLLPAHHQGSLSLVCEK